LVGSPFARNWAANEGPEVDAAGGLLGNGSECRIREGRGRNLDVSEPLLLLSLGNDPDPEPNDDDNEVVGE
jgi:hypothetical protein